MALIYPHKQAGDGTFLLCKCKCKCEVHVTSVGFTLVLVDGGNTAPAKRQGRTLQIETNLVSKSSLQMFNEEGNAFSIISGPLWWHGAVWVDSLCCVYYDKTPQGNFNRPFMSPAGYNLIKATSRYHWYSILPQHCWHCYWFEAYDKQKTTGEQFSL